jgi:hypothetical protein
VLPGRKKGTGSECDFVAGKDRSVGFDEEFHEIPSGGGGKEIWVIVVERGEIAAGNVSEAVGVNLSGENGREEEGKSHYAV